MSNNKKRRLNPIAAANAKRNKSLWTDPQTYAVLAIGTMIGIGVPSIAATVNAFPNPDASATTTTTTTAPSSATQEGLNTVKVNAFDAQDGGTAGGVVAGTGNGTAVQDDPAGSTVESDVISEATTCADPNNVDGLKAAHTEVLKDRQELVVTTVDVDALFNMDPKDPANEAASGCFAAAQQILDLSVAIPSIPTSWGDIGSIVTNQVTERLAQMQQEIFDRGCKIGLNALENTLSPIKDVLNSANNSSLLNDPAGFVGNYISQQVGSQLDASDLAFNGILDNITNDLAVSNQTARELAASVAQNSQAIELPASYNTSKMDETLNSGATSVLTESLARAKEELARVISAGPAQPMPTYHNSNGDSVFPVSKDGKVTNVSRDTYYDISSDYNQYKPNITAAQNRVTAAQSLLSGSSSTSTPTSYTSSYTPSASLSTTTVPNAVQSAPTYTTAPSTSSSTTTSTPSASTTAPTSAASTTGTRNPFS